jgi:multiple sugar transport system substrate-binding protein
MQYLRDLSAFFNSGVRAYQEESVRLAQELREIVLHYNWPFVVPIYRDKGLLPSRIRTAPLPAGPAGSASVLGGGYIGIPATAPHPREAARLIDYLLSPEVQKKLANQLGWFPVRPEGWEGFSEADREFYAGYMAMQPHVRARPNLPYYPAVSRIWQDGFYAIVFSGEDPAATLKQMQADIHAAAREATP